MAARIGQRRSRLPAMWRSLALAAILLILSRPAAAQITDGLEQREVCAGTLVDGRPVLSQCRLLTGKLDPQDRELWVRALVHQPAPTGKALTALYLSGAASSRIW